MAWQLAFLKASSGLCKRTCFLFQKSCLPWGQPIAILAGPNNMKPWASNLSAVSPRNYFFLAIKEHLQEVLGIFFLQRKQDLQETLTASIVARFLRPLTVKTFCTRSSVPVWSYLRPRQRNSCLIDYLWWSGLSQPVRRAVLLHNEYILGTIGCQYTRHFHSSSH